MTFEQAASIPEQWITAYQLLFYVAKVKEGETVLIHAAASGVGAALLQLCARNGVKTIAVSSSKDKLKFCQDLGAFAGVNYKETPDFREQVQQLTGGRGVDVILDPVMASNYHYNVDCIALDGRWVFYGAMGGSVVEQVDFKKLLMKRASFLPTTLKSRTDEYKAQLIKDMANETLTGFS